MAEQLYRWHWKARLPERRGQLFRLICTGALNSCLIEFLGDGWRVVTSRNALRKAPRQSPAEQVWGQVTARRDAARARGWRSPHERLEEPVTTGRDPGAAPTAEPPWDQGCGI